MDLIDKKILLNLSGDIEICERPYQALAEVIGIDEETLILRINSMIERGYLKRIAPILYHQRTKYVYNTLLALQVELESMDAVASYLAGLSKVSHVYHRESSEKWPFNLYGMCHGASETDIDQIVDSLTIKFKILKYKKINTVKEWKKTSPNLNYLKK